MENFWNGFSKQASALLHATELAGLGTLGVPSVRELQGKPMSEHGKSKAELAGLGILAIPSAVATAKAGKKLVNILRKR